MKFNVLHLAVESQVGKFVGPLLPYLIGSTVMFLNFCKSLPPFHLLQEQMST